MFGCGGCAEVIFATPPAASGTAIRFLSDAAERVHPLVSGGDLLRVASWRGRTRRGILGTVVLRAEPSPVSRS